MYNSQFCRHITIASVWQLHCLHVNLRSRSLLKFYNKLNNQDWEKSEFHIEANATVKLSRNHEKQELVDTHGPGQHNPQFQSKILSSAELTWFHKVQPKGLNFSFWLLILGVVVYERDCSLLQNFQGRDKWSWLPHSCMDKGVAELLSIRRAFLSLAGV